MLKDFLWAVGSMIVIILVVTVLCIVIFGILLFSAWVWGMGR